MVDRDCPASGRRRRCKQVDYRAAPASGTGGSGSRGESASEERARQCFRMLKVLQVWRGSFLRLRSVPSSTNGRASLRTALHATCCKICLVLLPCTSKPINLALLGLILRLGQGDNSRELSHGNTILEEPASDAGGVSDRYRAASSVEKGESALLENGREVGEELGLVLGVCVRGNSALVSRGTAVGGEQDTIGGSVHCSVKGRNPLSVTSA